MSKLVAALAGLQQGVARVLPPHELTLHRHSGGAPRQTVIKVGTETQVMAIASAVLVAGWLGVARGEGPGRQPGEAQTRRGRRGARRRPAPLAAQPRVSRAVAVADAADRVAAEIGVGMRALHLAQSELATLARTAALGSRSAT